MVVVQAMRAVTAVSAAALPDVLEANNTVEASVMRGALQSGDHPSTCCRHTVCAGVSRCQQPMIKRQQPLLLGARQQFKQTLRHITTHTRYITVNNSTVHTAGRVLSAAGVQSGLLTKAHACCAPTGVHVHDTGTPCREATSCQAD